MFHWYICGIIDAIRHPITTTTTTTTTQSQQYFVPSITTRRRLSFLLYILDPHRRRHMEESQQNRIVLLATTIPQHPHTTVVVGRFGIVIEPGPVVPSPLQEAIHRIYTNQNSNHSSNNSSNISTTTTTSSSSTTTIKNVDVVDDDTIRAGAIVYMYVTPEYRGIQNNIGGRALQVIHTIQRSCHCTYTLLVANDKTPPSDTSTTTTTTTTTTTARTGSDHDATTTTTTSMRYNDMKLVQWYRRNGYHIAEEIQDILGSPNGIYGVAMITSLWHNDDTMKYDVATPIIQWW